MKGKKLTQKDKVLALMFAIILFASICFCIKGVAVCLSIDYYRIAEFIFGWAFLKSIYNIVKISIGELRSNDNAE
jgi:hypothetical protein